MMNTLIIGYGNPLRGDDGLGWRAAERLTADAHESRATVIACHQLTPELAEPISRADLVIFIDAEERQPAGKLICRRIDARAAPRITFSHHLTPAALLHCARQLYGACPEAITFSVSSQSFACSEELSPGVAAVLPRLTERVCRLVRRREKREAPRRKVRTVQGHA
jgi:hydrogenase maturation protease